MKKSSDSKTTNRKRSANGLRVRGKRPKPVGVSARTCQYRGCTEPVEGRSLCRSHLRKATAMVRRGEITWENLERAGVAQKKHKADSEFSRWLKAKNAEGAQVEPAQAEPVQ